MLQQVFRWAIKTYELEIFDPTSGVELPARPIYRREVMTAKEIAYMLREAVGKPWEANIILAVALGLRPSEALGVDWSDIDWRSGWVHIQRGCHTLQSGETVEYPCKTRLSDRYLKLPRWALVRLRQIRGQRRRGRVRGDLTPRQVYTQYKRFLKSIGLGRCCSRGTSPQLGDARHRVGRGHRGRVGGDGPHHHADGHQALHDEHEGGVQSGQLMRLERQLEGLEAYALAA